MGRCWSRSGRGRELKTDAEKMKIPKFENEADEASWAYEHREELADAFITEFRQGAEEYVSPLEQRLLDSLQTRELVVVPEKLSSCTLVSYLREKLSR